MLKANEANDCLPKFDTPQPERVSAEEEEASPQLPTLLAHACDADSKLDLVQQVCSRKDLARQGGSQEATPVALKIKIVRFAGVDVILIPKDSTKEAMRQTEKEVRAMDRERVRQAWGNCLGPVAALAAHAQQAMTGTQEWWRTSRLATACDKFGDKF